MDNKLSALAATNQAIIITTREDFAAVMNDWLSKNQPSQSKPSASGVPDDWPRIVGYKRIKDLFPDVPESSFRQRVTAGKIPGFFKFGKILQCDSVIFFEWLAKQQSAALVTPDEEAEKGFENQHRKSRKSKRAAA
ncbi:hypothetical protein [Larkinella sp.]|uniref:hypothetical protein n=1 Tax=Larkinella sp. TaxID=2034517 RepID=UPI003BAC581C